MRRFRHLLQCLLLLAGMMMLAPKGAAQEWTTAEESRIRGIIAEYLDEQGVQTTSHDYVVDATPSEFGGVEIGNDSAMSAQWNNGLELSTSDKAFRVHVGGRWQFDASWFDAEQSVQNNLPGGVMYHDGVDFRRARLRIDGKM